MIQSIIRQNIIFNDIIGAILSAGPWFRGNTAGREPPTRRAFTSRRECGRNGNRDAAIAHYAGAIFED
jgi:hypothetical protein